MEACVGCCVYTLTIHFRHSSPDYTNDHDPERPRKPVPGLVRIHSRFILDILLLTTQMTTTQNDHGSLCRVLCVTRTISLSPDHGLLYATNRISDQSALLCTNCVQLQGSNAEQYTKPVFNV
ncbi:hypothetical protein J6590_059078 [Homalodisca vitripennis]|nr:hypothetical protein J6590_059078 [Homalodisca vitripennis]